MRRKGLTLMELLVVVSILATLSALLFPVYLRVRSKVYAVSCANQLRQIGLALKMYVHDQGEETPYSLPPSIELLYPNFQILAPEVVEEMQRLYPARWRRSAWSSYELIWPPAQDDIAMRSPGEIESFSEAFALRGDQTPIAFCRVHRTGCVSLYGINLMIGPKGTAFAKTYCSTGALAAPKAPIVILRWGGSVDLVYKGGLLFLIQGFLLLY